MSTLTARLRRRLAQARRALSAGGRLRPVRRWVLLVGPLALLLALVAPYRILFFVAYVFLLLALAAYAWVRALGPRVALRRRLRGEWAQVGDELVEDWELRNAAPLPLLWLEIDDGSSLPGYSARRVVSAGADSVARWQTSATCTRRGVFALGPLTARLADPLGLFRYEWDDGAARQIVVYPPLVHLPPLAMPRGQRGGMARADLLQVHTTPSVGGLREYVPGDVPSRIHWPTVARTEKLMVKEFDQERAGALWIALDLYAPAWRAVGAAPAQPQAARAEYTQRSAVGPEAPGLFESPLELAIALACSLAAQALGEGRAVGLLANDGQPRLLTPGRGPRQLWRVLSALVDAQAVGELPLGELLRQGRSAHAGQVAGAALVVITAALDGAWLPELASWRRGRPGGALALLVAADEAAARPLASQLAASGTAAQTFTPGTPLALINPPRPRTTLRVSPLGRVVGG